MSTTDLVVDDPRPNPAITAAILCMILSSMPVLRTFRTHDDADLIGEKSRAGELSGRVDPNAARWCELSHLPGIGETRARQIVEYRELIRSRRGSEISPVFQTPADLTKVPGIGATTAARLAPLMKLTPATE